MAASYSGTVPFVAHAHCPRGTRWRGTFPYHLFSLTLAGSATYSFPQGRVDIVAGDFLHFAPQAQQDWSVSTSSGWKVAYLILALPASLRQLFPPPTLAPRIGRVALDRGEAIRCARLFRDLQDWSERPTPLRQALIHNLLEQILLRLRSAAPLPKVDPRIGRAREYLHANLEAPVVLADVARAAHLSRARLCALFKQHLDTTPMAYLERLRLEQAARLLLFSSDSIASLAERFCYGERGYFEKRFKRHWGVTPKAYRLRGAEPS